MQKPGDSGSSSWRSSSWEQPSSILVEHVGRTVKPAGTNGRAYPGTPTATTRLVVVEGEFVERGPPGVALRLRLFGLLLGLVGIGEVRRSLAFPDATEGAFGEQRQLEVTNAYRVMFELTQKAVGHYPELAAWGEDDTGAENFGGPSITATGLIFCAGTPDEMIRAFDP